VSLRHRPAAALETNAPQQSAPAGGWQLGAEGRWILAAEEQSTLELVQDSWHTMVLINMRTHGIMIGAVGWIKFTHYSDPAVGINPSPVCVI